MARLLHNVGPIALVWLALAGGCAESSSVRVPRRQAGVVVGVQGGASELVFAGPSIVEAGSVEGLEAYRRDGRLARASCPGELDAGWWPRERATSLYGRRYLSIPTSASTYLYFEPDRRRPRSRPY